MARRNQVARRLFSEWVGVTDPDLLAGLWGNLSPEDRLVWLERADDLLGKPPEEN